MMSALTLVLCIIGKTAPPLGSGTALLHVMLPLSLEPVRFLHWRTLCQRTNVTDCRLNLLFFDSDSSKVAVCVAIPGRVPLL